MTTAKGSNLVPIFDTYAGGVPLPIMCVFETVGFCYIYGTSNIIKDNHIMVKNHKGAGAWYQMCWISCPLLIMCLIISSILSGDNLIAEGQPIWVKWFASILTALPLIPIPMYMIWRHITGQKTDTARNLSSPTNDWGPFTGEGLSLIHI